MNILSSPRFLVIFWGVKIQSKDSPPVSEGLASLLIFLRQGMGHRIFWSHNYHLKPLLIPYVHSDQAWNDQMLLMRTHGSNPLGL